MDFPELKIKGIRFYLKEYKKELLLDLRNIDVQYIIVFNEKPFTKLNLIVCGYIILTAELRFDRLYNNFACVKFDPIVKISNEFYIQHDSQVPSLCRYYLLYRQLDYSIKFYPIFKWYKVNLCFDIYPLGLKLQRNKKRWKSDINKINNKDKKY